MHTPRSTLAQWSGRAGAALEPLYDVHKRFVLASAVLHADETPVAMLDPGAGKTKKAYVWAYARGAFDPTPGVVYDFCLGRGAQYPIRFLGHHEKVTKAGAARLFAMNPVPTRAFLTRRRTPGASPQVAWPMHAGSSTS